MIVSLPKEPKAVITARRDCRPDSCFGDLTCTGGNGYERAGAASSDGPCDLEGRTLTQHLSKNFPRQTAQDLGHSAAVIVRGRWLKHAAVARRYPSEIDTLHKPGNLG